MHDKNNEYLKLKKLQSFHCLDDPSKVKFAGNMYSERAYSLGIGIIPKKCANGTLCYGQEEI